jgi:hypothetical protein
MIKSMRHWAVIGVALSIVVIFQNCGQPGAISASNPGTELAAGGTPTPTPTPTDVYGITVLPSTQFICEPFGNTNSGDAQAGLKAELAYVNPTLGLDATTKNSYGAADYFSGASQFVVTETPIFLSQVNVPTQSFDKGFLLSNGSYLSDTAGNKLIEWFALKMQSILKLGDLDDEGDYEIATISDDGSRVFLAPTLDGQQTEVVKNDGAHAATMQCGSAPITFSRSSRMPLTYYYNQGPRYHIANVMIWRKAVSSTTRYPLCGVTSITDYWDPNNASAPGKNWTQLQADGWKILGPDNFQLPDSQINPCATQNTNLITSADFTALLNGSSNLTVKFSTSANIVAKLYKVNADSSITLLQTFDQSNQIADQISLALSSLENGATYSVQILLQMAGSGTQVLNEVRFVVNKQ